MGHTQPAKPHLNHKCMHWGPLMYELVLAIEEACMGASHNLPKGPLQLKQGIMNILLKHIRDLRTQLAQPNAPR